MLNHETFIVREYFQIVNSHETFIVREYFQIVDLLNLFNLNMVQMCLKCAH